jgi:uncharacterized protein DUF3800
MAILYAHFDESGKYKDHKVVSFCGVCASLSDLQSFEREWGALLQKNGLPWLTMKRALKTTVKLSDVIPVQPANERIEALKPFAQCIKEFLELGVLMAIDVAAFNSMSLTAKKKVGGSADPYHTAFLRVMMLLADYAQGNHISLICDDDNETAVTSYRYYKRLRPVDSVRGEKFVALTFADDEHFLALQAADMLSSLTRLEAKRRFFSDYYDYVPLFNYLTDGEHKLTWQACFADQSALIKLSKGLDPSND